jgi:hypothetical protein
MLRDLASNLTTAERVGRPNSTLPKLVDEYFWMTISQGYAAPSRDLIGQWATWAS